MVTAAQLYECSQSRCTTHVKTVKTVNFTYVCILPLFKKKTTVLDADLNYLDDS